MKKILLRIALVAGVLILLAGLAVVVVIGPWPVYTSTNYHDKAYFLNTLAQIDASLARSEKSATPERLQAGWAVRDMTPPVGAPMAGYAGRPNDKISTGIHDPLYAKAIVLHDGRDTVAIVASDLLMTTLNLAERVWAGVAEDTPLTADTIFFTTSHTHCGVGGYMPGLLGAYSAGAYDPALETLIVEAMTGAILGAWADLGPAAMAHGTVDAPEFIFNRTNVETTDSALDFLLLEKESGESCYAVRYSAHATVLPDSFLSYSAEYPGVLCRELEAATGATVLFLGGAVGAMGPAYPKGLAPLEAMEAIGRGLAAKIIDYEGPLSFEEHIDILGLGADVGMPSMQARLGMEKWRLSPYFAYVMGLPPVGYVQALQLGDLVLLGLPHDGGGEIAVDWVADSAEKGRRLWVTSHAIAYCGYLSPDEYYWRETVGYDQGYEWRLMNWYGPDQEAMYTDIKDHILDAFLAE